ncbi:hypothetical protein AcW1_006430 [Taiwanofungus camphoratus]|nr:hypothetical protein AcW1_006430 [Antrodia cinnamomea]
MQSQSSDLPPELCDQILDHLWDDRAALEACSLTCRAWLATTRIHLFHSICLRDLRQCTRLERMLKGTLPTIVDVTHYIRGLTLMQREARGGDRALPESALQDGVVDDLPTFFPNVKMLTLHLVDFRNPEHILPLLNAYPKLSNVHISDHCNDLPPRDTRARAICRALRMA